MESLKIFDSLRIEVFVGIIEILRDVSAAVDKFSPGLLVTFLSVADFLSAQ